MRSVGAFEAKAHLAALLDAVSAGEQITITRHGHPVARLVPSAAEAPASVVDTITRLRQFSQGQSLGGIWEVFHQLLRGAELPTRLCTDAHLAALAIANGWRLQMCMTALSSTHRPWG
jgi:prevent-host-death family protein